MINVPWFTIGLFILIFALLFPWLFRPTVSKNFEIEVLLSVDGEIQTFTAVQSLTFSENPEWRIPYLPSYETDLRGNAVRIDLEGHTPLFVLMRSLFLGDDGPIYARSIASACNYFRDPTQDASSDTDFLENYRNFTGTCLVADEHLPLFGMMTNYPDLRTFIFIDPLKLEEEFSPNVRLVRIQFSTTNKKIVGNLLKEILAVAPNLPNAKPSGAAGVISLLNYRGKRPQPTLQTKDIFKG